MIIADHSRTMRIYMKVYTGSDELVSWVFLYTGTSATIRLPSGTCRYKTATGEYWYGDEQLCEDDGYSQILLFDGEDDTACIDAGSGPRPADVGRRLGR